MGDKQLHHSIRSAGDVEEVETNCHRQGRPGDQAGEGNVPWLGEAGGGSLRCQHPQLQHVRHDTEDNATSDE